MGLRFVLARPSRVGKGDGEALGGKKLTTDVLSGPSSPSISLARCNDRTLHEDVPAARESIGVPHSGLSSQFLEESTNGGEMPRRRPVQWVLAIIDLEKKVDEGASLEVVALKPLVEEIKDGHQATFGSRSSL